MQRTNYHRCIPFVFCRLPDSGVRQRGTVMQYISLKKELVFSFLLLLTAAIWGGAFVITKDTQQIVPTNYLLACRFSIAALGLLYSLFTMKGRISLRLIMHGCIAGFIMYSAFAVQTFGLTLTTASKNALISSSYVVIVPFLLWAIRKDNVGKRLFISAAMCFGGIMLLAPSEGGAVNIGDIVTLASGFLYAAHIVAVAIFSEKSELMPLTCMQFIFASIFSGSVAFATETMPSHLSRGTCLSIAWLGIMATLGAMTLMNLGIKYVSSTKTSIILSTESVFGCIFGIIFQNDPLTLPILIGGAIIVCSVILSQIKSGKAPAPEPMAA